MRTEIEAYRLVYGKFVKGINGGWNYTKTLLGTIKVHGEPNIRECERLVRQQYSKANQLAIYAVTDDKRECWLSGYV